MNKNPSLGFIEHIDHMMKELMLLGFGLIEDDFIAELQENAGYARKLGFDMLAVLLENVRIAALNYMRLASKAQVNALVSAIAKVEFMTSRLNMNQSDNASLEDKTAEE